MEETKQDIQPVNAWLEKIIEQSNLKAAELGKIFEREVTPVVFVVEDQKDAAVGFLKSPDARQSLKMFRMMASDYEGALFLMIQAELIRTDDLKKRNLEGEASDSRFMDANGKYDLQYSQLNFSLLMKGRQLIKIYEDQFKKK